MFGEEDLVRTHDDRGQLLYWIVLLAFALIVLRLIYLQIYRGDLLFQYSLDNRLREEIVRAPRGIIYSRDGKVLVNNTPRFDAVFTRQYLKNPKETFHRLSQILNLPELVFQKAMKKSLSQAAYRSVVLKRNITLEEVAKIETANDELLGVSVDVVVSRDYIHGDVGAHTLGYISEVTQDQLEGMNSRDKFNYKLGDYVGQFGLEKQYDRYLRGQNGIEYVEVDALGRKKRNKLAKEVFDYIKDVFPVSGQHLKLTLDSDLQLKAYEKLEGKVGAVVAVDIHTGEVLSLVSRPSFMPTEFSKGISKEYWEELSNNPDKPLRDRTLQEHYSPGSTFKPFTTMALLSERVFYPDQEIPCTGGVTLGVKTYHCWKKHGHGSVNLHRAIRESCNSYFQKAALKLDIDTIAHFAKLFGLGAKTGIDLPRETMGLIPTKEWKLQRNGREWQKGETLSCAIGQSYVLATLMQLVLAYGAIANGGQVFKPLVLKEVINQKGQVTYSARPQVLSVAYLPTEHLSLIREGLHQVVNDPRGTAYWFRGEGIDMAGKTGTSQVMGVTADKVYQKCEEMPMNRRHHGLFISYLPFDRPKIAIGAIVEHGCHGSSAAAPVVAAVAQEYMKKYHPKEYEEIKKLGKGYPLPVQLPAQKKILEESEADAEAPDV